MKLKEVYIRWLGIPLVSLFIVFFVKDPEESLLKAYLMTVLFTAFFWNGSYLIICHFRKKYPLIPQTTKRLLITIFSVSIFLVVGDILMCVILEEKSISQLNNPAILFDHAHINFIASFLVGTFYETTYFFENWKNTIKVNETLKNQQIRTQFEVLQNQMSPHFLFNSLNTLTTLIQEDPVVAADFTQRMSDVYRYILQNKEKELVHLSQELQFVKDYAFLSKMRFPKNLTIKFDIPEEYYETHIPPLTLQMLVENSLKHNVISAARPLVVNIYINKEKKCVVVQNNLQVKKVLEKSTKTGLENIKRRYSYLNDEEINVINDGEIYKVEVPLIEVYYNQYQEVLS